MANKKLDLVNFIDEAYCEGESIDEIAVMTGLTKKEVIRILNDIFDSRKKLYCLLNGIKV